MLEQLFLHNEYVKSKLTFQLPFLFLYLHPILV